MHIIAPILFRGMVSERAQLTPYLRRRAFCALSTAGDGGDQSTRAGTGGGGVFGSKSMT